MVSRDSPSRATTPSRSRFDCTGPSTRCTCRIGPYLQPIHTHQPAHRIYDLCGEGSSAALATHARFSFPPLSHSPTNSPFMSDRRAALHTTSAWHTIRQRLIPRPDVQPCWCGTFPTCLRRAGGGQNSKEGGTRRGYTIKRCSSAYRVRSAVELRWSFSIMRAR